MCPLFKISAREEDEYGEAAGLCYGEVRPHHGLQSVSRVPVLIISPFNARLKMHTLVSRPDYILTLPKSPTY